MAKPESDAATKSVLIVGVGGQGVIMVSKVLAHLCQAQGFEVKQSEVHGMAKRGGAVFSHVRFGARVWSPTIPQGEADILVALEWAEGLRWLPYLRSGSGTFIADTQTIVPPFACRNRRRGAAPDYAVETPREVLAHVGDGYALDAANIARDLGNVRAGNSVLLGALSTALDFTEDDWRQVIGLYVPPKTVEVNLRAFDAGRAWVGEAQRGVRPAAGPSPARKSVPPVVNDADHVRLEIIERWCKGCDICVKLCPERCLALNRKQIVVLTDPEACTGCRICEWLCPDFAITVHTVPAMAPSVV